MSSLRELLGVSWSGLSARRIRTFLIMLGPIVGVAAMVGAVGLTESAKGDLKQKLADLGTALLRLLPAETAHEIGLWLLERRALDHLPEPLLAPLTAGMKVHLPGIGELPHPIGLAAGRH